VVTAPPARSDLDAAVYEPLDFAAFAGQSIDQNQSRVMLPKNINPPKSVFVALAT